MNQRSPSDRDEVNPTDSLQVLERYSLVILPVLVVAEQVGIPLPAVPALLAVGALAAHGRVSLLLIIGTIAVVALAVDLVWHEVGRRRGAPVLSGLCRLSLEPDVCVRRTENLFLRYGVRVLLVSKFLPGLTTVMPPLAGVFGIPRPRFAIYDLAGVVLWASLCARVALQLKRRGITRVRPLEGGVAAWMALSFPVRELTVPAIPALERSRQ